MPIIRFPRWSRDDRLENFSLSFWKNDRSSSSYCMDNELLENLTKDAKDRGQVYGYQDKAGQQCPKQIEFASSQKNPATKREGKYPTLKG